MTDEAKTPAQELAEVLQAHKLKSQPVAQPVTPQAGIIAKLKSLWS